MLNRQKVQSNIITAAAALLFAIITHPLYSDTEAPFFQSSGDSISANIIFPTIANNLKQQPSLDMKIKNASLKKSLENTISIDITFEIIKPQFRGTVCMVNSSLLISSLALDGAAVKIQTARIAACDSKKGSGMDALVRAAAGIALNRMIPEMEGNIQKSINDALIPMVKILKERTGQNAAIEYAVHEQGLAIYIYTGSLIAGNFKKLSYTVRDAANCMASANIEIFQIPSPGKNDRIRMFVRNESGDTNSLEAVMNSSVLRREIYSEKIASGTEFYWSDDQKKYSGRDFSVGLRLFSPDSVKNPVMECGTMSLAVPERGSVMIQIAR